MNAVVKKTRFAVTGRNVLEFGDSAGFTRPQFLGEVVAFNEEQGEKLAQIRWPGWADYSLWPVSLAA